MAQDDENSINNLLRAIHQLGNQPKAWSDNFLIIIGDPKKVNAFINKVRTQNLDRVDELYNLDYKAVSSDAASLNLTSISVDKTQLSGWSYTNRKIGSVKYLQAELSYYGTDVLPIDWVEEVGALNPDLFFYFTYNVNNGSVGWRILKDGFIVDTRDENVDDWNDSHPDDEWWDIMPNQWSFFERNQ